MPEYSTNVILLLLQILFRHQEILAHGNKSEEFNRYLAEPIIDERVLDTFTNHKLVKIYEPELCSIQLRGLRMLVEDLFLLSPEQETAGKEWDVLSLANFYYAKRIAEIEQRLPEIRGQFKESIK